MGDLCAADGIARPTAVLASGNVVFFADEGRETAERAIEGRFGAAAPAFLYSEDGVRLAIADCPFEAGEGLHRYAVLCDADFIGAPERAWAAAARGGRFCWQTPKGPTLGAGRSKAPESRVAAPHVTARNLNTLQKVAVKMAELARA